MKPCCTTSAARARAEDLDFKGNNKAICGAGWSATGWGRAETALAAFTTGFACTDEAA